MNTGISREEVKPEPPTQQPMPEVPKSEAPQTSANFVNMAKKDYDEIQEQMNRLRGLNANSSNNVNPPFNILRRD